MEAPAAHHPLSGNDLPRLKELAAAHPDRFLGVGAKLSRAGGKKSSSGWLSVTLDNDPSRRGAFRATNPQNKSLGRGTLLECVELSISAARFPEEAAGVESGTHGQPEGTGSDPVGEKMIDVADADEQQVSVLMTNNVAALSSADGESLPSSASGLQRNLMLSRVNSMNSTLAMSSTLSNVERAKLEKELLYFRQLIPTDSETINDPPPFGPAASATAHSTARAASQGAGKGGKRPLMPTVTIAPKPASKRCKVRVQTTLESTKRPAFRRCCETLEQPPVGRATRATALATARADAHPTARAASQGAGKGGKRLRRDGAAEEVVTAADDHAETDDAPGAVPETLEQPPVGRATRAARATARADAHATAQAASQEAGCVGAVPAPPAQGVAAGGKGKESAGGPTAAGAPGLVTHGLTLRGGLLTYAILEGTKRVENRNFKMQKGWYALHTGAKMCSHKSQHALLASLVDAPAEEDLPHSSIVGAIEISHALSLEQCSAAEPWAFGPMCNVIRSRVKLERPVAHRGALSLWPIDADVLQSVRAQLQAAPVRVNDIRHLSSAAKRAVAERRTGERAPGATRMARKAPRAGPVPWHARLHPAGKGHGQWSHGERA